MAKRISFQSRSHFAVIQTLFTILGWFAVGFGLLYLPTACFVGPHLLAAATGLIAFGLGSLVAARGFQRETRWASWCASALCAIAVAVALVAVLQSALADEWESVAVWAMAATYFAATLFAVFTNRPGRGA